MKTGMSFNEVCEFLRKGDAPSVETLDHLAGLLLLLFPATAAGLVLPGSVPNAVAAGLALITAKNEITKITQSLVKKFLTKKGGVAERYNRMSAAYCLTCYAAFFDALDDLLPEVMEKMELTSEEKARIVQGVSKKTDPLPQRVGASFGPSNVLSQEIPLPHPVDGYGGQKAHLRTVYGELAGGVVSFLEGLAPWDTFDETYRSTIRHTLTQKLPAEALSRLDAQYLALAAKFSEFYIWLSLHNHQTLLDGVGGLNATVQRQVQLSQDESRKVDRGLTMLSELVATLPHTVGRRKSNRVVDALKDLYVGGLELPITKDSGEEPGEEPSLVYPTRSRIFVPQRFRVLRRNVGQLLERKESWEALPVRNDIATFLLEYLSSPYSKVGPLLILGHPGAGKSLLTRVMAGRLCGGPFMPLRVELRRVNPESDIPAQVEEQIAMDLSDRGVSWADISEALPTEGAVILLDGYDELLQASGRTYSGFLKKVAEFQQRELQLGRKPVHAIVTSRVTLVDRADIPVGCTVIRFEDFDEAQRQSWIGTWNDINGEYYRRSGRNPFRLPESKRLEELAGQPLLLFMLALYHATGERSDIDKKLDQTTLYDNLLRRFVERERLKKPAFRNLDALERRAVINQEMRKLGTAAVGMFVRGKFHLSPAELDQDLSLFLDQPYAASAVSGALSKGALLLGSFFFIQESCASTKGELEKTPSQDIAHEFLHNTFGEFLAADFIIHQLLQQTKTIAKKCKDQDLLNELVATLRRPEYFDASWHHAFMWQPLFSRPVIMAMMREWLPHCLAKENHKAEEFLAGLDMIVDAEIKKTLGSGSPPAAMMGGGAGLTLPARPLTGYMATYSLNLVLLRAILSDDGYRFREEDFHTDSDMAPPWDRLSYLWRSWFPLDALDRLASVVDTHRDSTVVILKGKPVFSETEGNKRFHQMWNASQVLGDRPQQVLMKFLDTTPSEELQSIRDDSSKYGLEFPRVVGDILSHMTADQKSIKNVDRPYSAVELMGKIDFKGGGIVCFNAIRDAALIFMSGSGVYTTDLLGLASHAIEYSMYEKNPSLAIEAIHSVKELFSLFRVRDSDSVILNNLYKSINNAVRSIPISTQNMKGGVLMKRISIEFEFNDGDMGIPKTHVRSMIKKIIKTVPLRNLEQYAELRWAAHKIGSADLAARVEAMMQHRIDRARGLANGPAEKP